MALRWSEYLGPLTDWVEKGVFSLFLETFTPAGRFEGVLIRVAVSSTIASVREFGHGHDLETLYAEHAICTHLGQACNGVSDFCFDKRGCDAPPSSQPGN